MTVNLKHLGPMRQIVVAGTGREKPMLMITNDPELSAKEAIIRYSHRWRTENSRAKTLFRNFVEGNADIRIDDKEVRVKVEKRGRNPLLMDLVDSYPDVRVPWWGSRRLVFEFV
jgi:hypothetical protein